MEWRVIFLYRKVLFIGLCDISTTSMNLCYKRFINIRYKVLDNVSHLIHLFIVWTFSGRVSRSRRSG